MTTMDDLANALYETLLSPNETGSNFEAANVVDGLFAIARAIGSLANAIDRLGTNNAATGMGAIELRDGLGSIVGAVSVEDRP